MAENKNETKVEEVNELDKKWALLTDEQKKEMFKDDSVKTETKKEEPKEGFMKKHGKKVIGFGVAVGTGVLGLITGVSIGKKSADKKATETTTTEPFTTVE